jgi:KaiC/GvpD/RAD55 family RecA-like ATPase
MNPRDPRLIAVTPGYVTIVEGQPGTGKTSFSLLAATRKGKILYISYSEPESYIRGRIKRLNPRFRGELKFMRMMGGQVERVVSTIIEHLAAGYVVIVDSINAMISEVKDPFDNRTLNELLYGTTKDKPGSLILISEGNDGGIKEFEYVSDAIVRVGYFNVFERRVRSMEVIKDRNYPVRQPPYFFTFNNGKMKVLDNSLKGIEGWIPKRFERITMPSGTWLFTNESRILVELDSSVGLVLNRAIRETIAAYFLLNGFAVIFELRPDEFRDVVASEITSMSGTVDRLTIIEPPIIKNQQQGMDFLSVVKSAVGQYKSMPVVTIADVVFNEQLASSDMSSYNMYVQQLSEMLFKAGAMQIIFAYTNYYSLQVQEKYAFGIKRMIDVYGNIFWETVRPSGNIFYVSVDLRKNPRLINYHMS